MIYRASSVPRILRCPASSVAPDIYIDESGEAAAVGSAVHNVLAQVVEEGLTQLPEVGKAAELHRLEDYAELIRLGWAGVNALEDLRPSISNILGVEKSMACAEFKGTADMVFESDDGALCVLDWKSGFADADYADQLMTYAIMARATFGAYERYKTIIVWLRSREIEINSYEIEDLRAWELRWNEVIKSDRYTPGEHCKWCPRQFDCEARAQMVRAVSKDLVEIEAGQLTTNELADLYPKVLIVEKACKRYKDVLRAAVKDAGTVKLSDGRIMSMEEQEKKSIKFNKAYSYLMGYFECASIQDLLDVIGKSVTLGKKGLLDIIGEGAPRGQKGKRKMAVMDDLEKADAVSSFTSHRLSIKKPK